MNFAKSTIVMPYNEKSWSVTCRWSMRIGKLNRMASNSRLTTSPRRLTKQSLCHGWWWKRWRLSCKLTFLLDKMDKGLSTLWRKQEINSNESRISLVVMLVWLTIWKRQCMILMYKLLLNVYSKGKCSNLLFKHSFIHTLIHSLSQPMKWATVHKIYDCQTRRKMRFFS